LHPSPPHRQPFLTPVLSSLMAVCLRLPRCTRRPLTIAIFFARRSPPPVAFYAQPSRAARQDRDPTPSLSVEDSTRLPQPRSGVFRLDHFRPFFPRVVWATYILSTPSALTLVAPLSSSTVPPARLVSTSSKERVACGMWWFPSYFPFLPVVHRGSQGPHLCVAPPPRTRIALFLSSLCFLIYLSSLWRCSPSMCSRPLLQLHINVKKVIFQRYSPQSQTQKDGR